ncbi:MAG: IS630 family transposase [Bacteroidetes bacterium]|nr:IS630 family transposase [Bacteroidota bacterium]
MRKKTPLKGKKLDGRKLSHEQSEYIRVQAVKAVRIGKKSPAEVIKTFGLHRANIYKWLARYDAGGLEALMSTKAKGPEPKLTGKQKRVLLGYLLKNPLQLKFEFGLWTVAMVAELIEKKFSVSYSKVHVGRLLGELGLSRQRPLERAYQQDPDKVREWLEHTFPAIKREAKREDRDIFFVDEAGFHATAQYGTTWAPIGQTPVIKTTGRREKVNCISAISKKGELRFMLYQERFTGAVFTEFLRRFMRGRTSPATIVVDGHRTHSTKQVKEFVRSTRGALKIYELPAYSPELNPDELVWNNAKQKVAKRKHTPRGNKSFKQLVHDTMRGIQSDTGLVQSFFRERNVAYAM